MPSEAKIVYDTLRGQDCLRHPSKAKIVYDTPPKPRLYTTPSEAKIVYDTPPTLVLKLVYKGDQLIEKNSALLYERTKDCISRVEQQTVFHLTLGVMALQIKRGTIYISTINELTKLNEQSKSRTQNNRCKKQWKIKVFMNRYPL